MNDGLTKFAKLHLPALKSDEARNNLIIAVITGALNRPDGNLRFWSCGSAGACAVQSPGWRLILGTLDEAQCTALASEFDDVDYPAVMGPDETTTWFTTAAGRLGKSFLAPIEQQVLSIKEPPVFPDCAGAARTLTRADGALVANWMIQFHAEATPHNPAPDREHLEQSAASGRYMFWCVDGKPVSIAAIARRLGKLASINSVYTPPQLRRKGYAGAVTATLVERIYAEGKTMACLLVDMSNPGSIRCYKKIGFRKHCRFNYIARDHNLPE